jgi:HEAT repeat protein
MKNTLVGLGWVVAAALGPFLACSRQPLVPDKQDRLGLLPMIPGEKRSPAELAAALKDADATVRREALRSFGRALDHGSLKATDVVPLLLNGVEDPEPGVRAVAAAYLGFPQAGAATAVPALTALLMDPDELVRVNAANGLRTHAPAIKDAIPALVVAWNDTNSDVRQHVSSALLQFPEVRYTVPADWAGLSPDEAQKRVSAMGRSLEGESLHRAVRENDIAGVFMLLKAGVDPNSPDSTQAAPPPLCHVSPIARPEIVRLLLDFAADVNRKDKNGRTPLDWVAGRFNDRFRPFGEESLDMLRKAAAGG